MTIRSVDDASMPSGSPVRLDVTLASTPGASTPGAEQLAYTITSVAEDGRIQDAEAPDTTRYDSAWASTEIPTKEPDGFEQFMVGGGKIYVVLAVVLIIWIGLLAFLFSTDRRIRSLEREAD
jgi:CcmD family protein